MIINVTFDMLIQCILDTVELQTLLIIIIEWLTYSILLQLRVSLSFMQG